MEVLNGSGVTKKRESPGIVSEEIPKKYQNMAKPSTGLAQCMSRSVCFDQFVSHHLKKDFLDFLNLQDLGHVKHEDKSTIEFTIEFTPVT